MTVGFPSKSKRTEEIHALLTRPSKKFRDAYEKGATIDKDHDVPYVAGYSKTGRTIYFDRRLPRLIRGIPLEPYLREHELVESILIHQFGWDYQDAHHAATQFEKRKVEADGELTWREYQAFFKPWIKRDETKMIAKPPKDLDLTPYRDEHDTGALKRLGAQD